MKAATIAHISDIHFGRLTSPEIVQILVDEINEQGVDLVAVSGDLTQRARSRQFADAAEMLNAFAAPVLVVPGNHDVYAWWRRPISRMFWPLRRYREYISEDLAPIFQRDGLAVLGINSAHGRTIKGGHIRKDARERIASFFGDVPADAFKVLVVHHHLTKIQALGPHDVARKAQDTLEIASDAGVDLVLCGHLHVSHIEPVEIVPSEHRVVIASAGTATSNRGRGAHRETNFYNLVTVEAERFTIEERRFSADRRRFVRDCVTDFERDVEL